ncbi:unnamed protein product [Microthlaspi erraticum]|uniref:F-box associated domain-containing protein n=1 Tax=Microthlaspi erraticum TaxID=1685480 RepID=A0A6D2KA64_9BRAS|nr:unnamed protein product [Microthlaspi erraticum]
MLTRCKRRGNGLNWCKAPAAPSGESPTPSLGPWAPPLSDDKDMKDDDYDDGRLALFNYKGDIVLLSYSFQLKLYFVVFFNPEKKTFKRVYIQGDEEFKHRRDPTFLDYVENLRFT